MNIYRLLIFTLGVYFYGPILNLLGVRTQSSRKVSVIYDEGFEPLPLHLYSSRKTSLQTAATGCKRRVYHLKQVTLAKGERLN